MPHKRNPVLSENLTGLARIIRAAVAPALENITLWHERDISHSAVERVMAPDATIALDFALARLTGVIDKLLVYPEAMQRNLDLYGGLVHSQRVLLALTQAGMAREEAYRAVQRNAMRVWQEGADFLDPAEGRSGGRGKAAGRRARSLLRPRLPHAAGGYDLQAGVRGRLSDRAAPNAAARTLRRHGRVPRRSPVAAHNPCSLCRHGRRRPTIHEFVASKLCV